MTFTKLQSQAITCQLRQCRGSEEEGEGPFGGQEDFDTCRNDVA